jgi:hypothetical protein
MTPKAKDGLASDPSLNCHPHRGVHRRVGVVPRGAAGACAQARRGPAAAGDDDHHPPAADDHDDAPRSLDHRRSDDHVASDHAATAELVDLNIGRNHHRHDDANLDDTVHLTREGHSAGEARCLTRDAQEHDGGRRSLVGGGDRSVAMVCV